MSRKYYLYLFLFCFASLFIAFMLFFNTIKSRALILNRGVITRAVITQAISVNDAACLAYEFKVNGEKIKGDCTDDYLPENRVGDTIFVKYIPNDPARCAVIKELDGSLVKWLASYYK